MQYDQAMERTYHETHPWLDIGLGEGLAAADHEFWALVGEAGSKVEFLSDMPMRPDRAARLLQIVFIKGTQATVAIEGNSFSVAEIAAEIDGVQPVKSKEYHRQEVRSALRAYNGVASRLEAGESLELTPSLIMDLNSQLLGGVGNPDAARPGQVSLSQVSVGSYVGAPREDCDFLLSELCDSLNEFKDRESSLSTATRGILAAVIGHLYLAWIHPFADGNGRTARLLETLILLKAGVPKYAAHLFSNHYNENRDEYYLRLKQSSEQRNPVIFYKFALQGFVDSLREKTKGLLGECLVLAWNELIHDRYPDDGGGVSDRKRHLLMDLRKVEAFKWPKHIVDLAQVSPRSFKVYFGKADRTLARDLGEFVDRGYLVRSGTLGIVAPEFMKPFLSPFAPKARTGEVNIVL